MDMPRPTEHHARLARLVGEWTGRETMHPSPWAPQARNGTGHVTCRMGLDGFFLIEDYRQEQGGQVTYQGHGLFGYDPKRGVYTMHWFDSMGAVPAAPADGTWEGDSLVFHQRSAMGHARYTYLFHSGGSYDFALDHSNDGVNYAPFVTCTYHRAF